MIDKIIKSKKLKVIKPIKEFDDEGRLIHYKDSNREYWKDYKKNRILIKKRGKYYLNGDELNE